MVRKTYCDVCKKEINSRAYNKFGRLEGKHNSISYEITTGYQGTWYAGDLCPRCIVRAIVKDLLRRGIINE